MAFKQRNSKGIDYFLHGKMVTLKGGRKQQIYFFAKTVRSGDALDELPAGYKVVENKRTGLPILKKA